MVSVRPVMTLDIYPGNFSRFKKIRRLQQRFGPRLLFLSHLLSSRKVEKLMTLPTVGRLR